MSKIVIPYEAHGRLSEYAGNDNYKQERQGRLHVKLSCLSEHVRR